MQKDINLSLQLRAMQQNNNSTVLSPTKYSSTTDGTRSLTGNVSILLNHWAFDFYAYIFAILFGIFALACFAAFVRQQTQRSRSRNIHGRFTTFQLFLEATLRVVDLFLNPIVLRDVSTEIFTGSLIIESLCMALSLSALSILLLILLETTKTSLAAPRLQNIWALLRRHYGSFHSNTADIQLTCSSWQPGIVVLRFIRGSFRLGNNNLCWVHCSRM